MLKVIESMEDITIRISQQQFKFKVVIMKKTSSQILKKQPGQLMLTMKGQQEETQILRLDNSHTLTHIVNG